MLIIPAEHPLDWKRPPVITLLLILLNCLIYFAYQSGDEARQEAAIKSYLDGGLLNRERNLIVERLMQEHELKEYEREQVQAMPRQQLAAAALTDLEFEQQIHQRTDYQTDAQWQAKRQAAEAARDKISSFRFGFIPERFTVQGLFGAMFLHGSFDHLFGNMLFLFIFGFALELALGKATYLLLYLASGLASHLLWWAVEPAWVPGVGASGAIAGLMGMYLGVYGLRKIKFFYWLGPLFGYFTAPALWVLPVFLGKELYGALLADNNVNYWAHFGGIAFGFIAVWLPRQFNRIKVDEAYINKEDADAPFKRELQALDQLIGRFVLDQAATRGLDLLQRYPERLELLDKLYPVAKTRQDKALFSALLKQLFALPAGSGQLALLQKLASDAGEGQSPMLRHPSVLLHLLQHLLREGDSRHALHPWRLLAAQTPVPAQLATLSLQLSKLLGQRGDRHSLADVARLLREQFPEAEQTRQVNLLQAHLAR